jgi:hypothetical protein
MHYRRWGISVEANPCMISLCNLPSHSSFSDEWMHCNRQPSSLPSRLHANEPDICCCSWCSGTGTQPIRRHGNKPVRWPSWSEAGRINREDGLARQYFKFYKQLLNHVMRFVCDCMNPLCLVARHPRNTTSFIIDHSRVATANFLTFSMKHRRHRTVVCKL